MASFLAQRNSRFMLFGLGERQVSWRGVGWLATVFFGSLFIAAVLAPPLFWFAEWLNAHFHSNLTERLIGYGVDVYFDRLRMLAIVCALPWLMARCHLWSWRALGLAWDQTGWRRFFLMGLVGLALIVGLACLRGVTTTAGVRAAVSALLAGLILGFLEETIFRGMILRMFYTAVRQPWLALALMALFFAYTHFKVPGEVMARLPAEAHADTGLVVAYWTLGGIAQNFDAMEFLILWLLGLALGALVLRTGSLMPSIGLHAGIVAAMTFYRGSNLTNNWMAAAALGLLFLLIVFTPAKKSPPTSSGEPSTIDNP